MSERLAGDDELDIEVEFEDDDLLSDTESDDDADGQRVAENEQEQPRTITQKIGNAIEDLIPGDSDENGH
jgi:hypothetical protein